MKGFNNRGVGAAGNFVVSTVSLVGPRQWTPFSGFPFSFDSPPVEREARVYDARLLQAVALSYLLNVLDLASFGVPGKRKH